jgi:hypothetical protein
VSGANDLPGLVVENNGETSYRDVPPFSRLAVTPLYQFAPTTALRTAGAIAVRLHPEVEHALSGLKIVAGDNQVLESEEIAY